MKGVLGSLPRLGPAALAVAIVITIAFHRMYSDVEITAGLTLEFALLAIVLVAGFNAAWSAVARRRKSTENDAGASPPPAGGS